MATTLAEAVEYLIYMKIQEQMLQQEVQVIYSYLISVNTEHSVCVLVRPGNSIDVVVYKIVGSSINVRIY